MSYKANMKCMYETCFDLETSEYNVSVVCRNVQSQHFTLCAEKGQSNCLKKESVVNHYVNHILKGNSLADDTSLEGNRQSVYSFFGGVHTRHQGCSLMSGENMSDNLLQTQPWCPVAGRIERLSVFWTVMFVHLGLRPRGQHEWQRILGSDRSVI